jgi:hypothetical protein
MAQDRERLNFNSTATLQRGFKAKEKRYNGNVASAVTLGERRG